MNYTPSRGDLVVTPRGNAAIVTHVAGDLVSVRCGDGTWESLPACRLTPFATNEPHPRISNFDAILEPELESFAPGFEKQKTCDGCHEADVDLVEIQLPDGSLAWVCPACAYEANEALAEACHTFPDPPPAEDWKTAIQASWNSASPVAPPAQRHYPEEIEIG